MGGHYGSVQVRTEQRERVKQAAEAVAHEHKIKCLIGPALNGWVGIYPENNGQDEKIGEALAGRLPGEHVMHVLVHDDDILAYWLWRDGQLADSYWSAPGYFGEEDRAAQERMAGKPEVLASIAGAKTDALRELLRRDVKEFTFEVERLERFGKLMGIPNLVAAYEYLKEGERDGIQGWREFDEIPADDLKREKQAARDEAKRLAAVKKGLRDGLLLAEKVKKSAMPQACRAGEGFVVCWTDFAKAQFKTELEWYRSPWAGADAVALEGFSFGNGIASDASGALMIAAMGRDIALWEAETWRPVTRWHEPDGTICARVSADGKLAAHVAAGQPRRFVATDVHSGRRLLDTSIGQADLAEVVIHPSGRWLIAAGSFLVIWEIGPAPVPRLRFVGGVDHLSSNVQRSLAGYVARTLDVDAVRKQFRQTMEKMLKRVGSKKGGKGELLSNAEAEAVQKSMAEQEQRMVDELLKAKANPIETPPQANERVFAVGFSSDIRDGHEGGSLMWWGTSHGLRVYDWSAVIESGQEEMPAPIFQSNSAGGYIYAVAQEAGARALLFGGQQGRAYRMDLATGAVREFLSLPEPAWVTSLIVSRDGKALGMTLRSAPEPSTNRQSSAWQIWSVDALLARAGGERD